VDDGVVHHRLGRLPGEQHELPSMSPGAAQHAGGRAGGIAELDVDVRHMAVRANLYVDHEPGFVELVVEQAAADRLAHRARRTVATDQTARADIGGAGRRRHPRRHAVRVLDQAVEPLAQAHVGAGQSVQPLAQRRFQARLVKHVAAAPTRRGLERRPQFHQHLAVGRAELVVGQIAGVPPHPIGDAQLLERPHDLVVEVDRAWQRVRLDILLDGDHPRAALGEQRRQHRAGRPQADDQDVAVEGAHVRLRWRRDCPARPDPRFRPARGRRA